MRGEDGNEERCGAEGVGLVDRRALVEQCGRGGYCVFLDPKMERGESLAVGRIGCLAGGDQSRHFCVVIADIAVCAYRWFRFRRASPTAAP